MGIMSDLLDMIMAKKKRAKADIAVVRDTVEDPNSSLKERLEAVAQAEASTDDLIREVKKAVESEPYAQMQTLMAKADPAKDKQAYTLMRLVTSGYVLGPEFIGKYLNFGEGEMEEKLKEGGHIGFITTIVERVFDLISQEQSIQESFNAPDRIGQWGENLAALVEDINEEYGDILPPLIAKAVESLVQQERLINSHIQATNVAQAGMFALTISIANQSKQLIDTQTALKNAKKELEELEDAIEDRKAENDEIEGENKTLQQQNASLTDAHQSLTSENAILKDDNARLKRSQAELEDRNKVLIASNQALEGQIASANKVLEGINRSQELATRALDMAGRVQKEPRKPASEPEGKPTQEPMPDESKPDNVKKEPYQEKKDSARETHNYKCPHCGHLMENSVQVPKRWKDNKDSGKGSRLIKCTSCGQRFNAIPQLKAELKARKAEEGKA